VRIGRGAAANVALNDQGVMGTLRVWFDGTIYKAANEVQSTTGNPVPLRGETDDGGTFPIPPGAAGPWYGGHRIWVTELTCLLLTIDPDLKLDDGRVDVRRSRPEGEVKKQRDRVKLVLSLLMLGAAGFILLQDSPQQAMADRSEREVGDTFRRTEGQLRTAADPLKGNKAARPADVVLGLLRDARFAEVSGRRAEAAERYVAARDELNRALGPSDAPAAPVAGSQDLTDALIAAREFVADRLVVHREFVTRERPGR
jgi:hypothetical protein